MKHRIFHGFLAVFAMTFAIFLFLPSAGQESFAAPNDVISTVAEYDAQVKEYYNIYGSNVVSHYAYEKLVLEREFVSRTGYDELQKVLTGDDAQGYADMLTWLFNDVEFMEMYLTGGTPGGNYLTGGSNYTNTTAADPYIDTLKVLYRFWSEGYRDDLDNHEHNNMYRKMIICLCLTQTGNVRYWINTGGSGTADNSINYPDPIRRYDIYCYLYDEGLLVDYFEDLEVPEMRYVLGSSINDDDIVWASNTAKANNYNTNCYFWMSYRKPDYLEDKNYESESWAAFDEKYSLSAYGVTNNGYGVDTMVKYPRLWMCMEDGGICWHIANFCQNLWSSYGRPCLIAGSMGTAHEVYLAYTRMDDGRGRWTIENAQGGNWNNTHRGAYANGTWKVTRWMNDWGVGEEFNYNNGSYICLAQAAINEYTDFVNCEVILMLADVFDGDEEVLEQIYRDALDVQDFNFDAWYDMVKLYRASGTKTDADRAHMALELIDAMTLYPLPMDDLLNILGDSVTSGAYSAIIASNEHKALTSALSVTDDESLQAYAVKTIANWLLGENEFAIGTFSFDGENAGCIVLTDEFGENDYWEYSLDGGKSWSGDNFGNVAELTDEELSMLNADDDILIRFEQVPEHEHIIEIEEAAIPSGLYLNDWENRLIGSSSALEYSADDGGTWQDYTSDVSFPGNATVIFRVKPYGNYVASDWFSYTFTEDTHNTQTRQYIPLSEVSLYAYSSQNSTSMAAANLIDGTVNTHWHNTYSGEDEKYYAVAFDSVKFISAVEFINYNGSNGRPKVLELYASMDGENWDLVQTYTGLPNTGDIQMLTIDEENIVQSKYMKLVYVETYGNSSSQVNMFAAGKLLNFYEDPTRVPEEIIPDEEIHSDEEIYPDDDLYHDETVDDDTLHHDDETGSDDTHHHDDATGSDDALHHENETGSDDAVHHDDATGSDDTLHHDDTDSSDDTLHHDDTAHQNDSPYTVEYDYSDDGILVTITSQTKLLEMEGWELDAHGLTLSRVYDYGSVETFSVFVTDEHGNEDEVVINLAGSDENELGTDAVSSEHVGEESGEVYTEHADSSYTEDISSSAGSDVGESASESSSGSTSSENTAEGSESGRGGSSGSSGTGGTGSASRGAADSLQSADEDILPDEDTLTDEDAFTDDNSDDGTELAMAASVQDDEGEETPLEIITREIFEHDQSGHFPIVRAVVGIGCAIVLIEFVILFTRYRRKKKNKQDSLGDNTKE